MSRRWKIRRPEATVIVHDLGHAKAALEASLQSGIPVTLRTAPDAVRYAGLGFLDAMLNQAAQCVPEAAFARIIDCGVHAALAHQAMTDYGADIAFSGPSKTRAKLESIAAQTKTTLHGPRTQRRTLDLLDSQNPFTDCLHYLEQHKP